MPGSSHQNSWYQFPLATRLGQFGLIYFSFSVFYGQAQANQGLLMILVALFLGRTLDYKKVIHDPLFLSSVLFMTYVFLRAMFAVLEHPDKTGLIVDYASDWAFLGLFPALIVAAALHVSKFKPHQLLGLAAAGFLFRIALRTDWSNGYEFFAKYFIQEQARASYGFAYINLPLWSLFLLMGLILYCDDFTRSSHKGLGLLKIAALLMTAIILVFIIVISKTRSIWILSCLFIPVCVFLKSIECYKMKQRVVAWAVVLTLLLPGYLIYQHFSFFQQRLTTEKDVIAQIVSMDHKDIPPTSSGLRYYMIRVFIDNALLRPAFGWGPGLSKKLLTESPYPGMQQVSHFHNIVIETFLQLGLVGLGLFLSMFVILFKNVLTHRHTLYNATRFRWLLFCATLVFCVTGLIEHTLWSSSTPYFFALMGGFAYAPRAYRYIRSIEVPSPLIPDEDS